MKIEIANLIESNHGELPYFSSLGGYPLFYVTNKADVLCPCCSNDILKGKADPYLNVEPDDIVAYEVNWDDKDLYCINNHKIDSATIDLEGNNED